MKHLTDAEVKDLIKSSKKLVVIQLSANWCPGCIALKPKMEELSSEKASEADIVYVDIDDNPDIAVEHGVRSIPTMLFYKDNVLVDTVMGNKTKDAVIELIESHSKDKKMSLDDDF